MNALNEGISEGADKLKENNPYLDVPAAKIFAIAFGQVFQIACTVDGARNYNNKTCEQTLNKLWDNETSGLFDSCLICVNELYAAAGLKPNPLFSYPFCTYVDDLVVRV